MSHDNSSRQNGCHIIQDKMALTSLKFKYMLIRNKSIMVGTR